MALISQSDFQARLGRNLSADELSAFGVINAANQAYVEAMIGSSVESAVETTRYYDGGVQHLAIDPCTDISAIKLVDDDGDVTYTYEARDFTKEPVNKTLKTMLRHRAGRFSRGINNIGVTAKFSIYGDTAVLNTVKDALLNALIAEMDNGKDIKRESIEGYSVEFASTETRSTLDKLRFLFPGV